MTATPEMTSAERVLATLSGREPDRVPYFLPVTMHGALEVGVPLDKYYQSARLMAEGQLRLRAKYRDDIVYPFAYGAIEVEAFGGEVEFFADGPPNSVGPLLSDPNQITNLNPPVVADSEPLRRVLDTIETLSAAIVGEALIVGVIMSPFSLPIMQLGFEQYLNLLYEQPDLARRLHAVNESFAVAWANAQLAAGANAIGYFDPISSPTVLSAELFTEYGLPMMRRVMSAVSGPCAALLASGLSEPLIDDLATTGAVIVGASSDEDLAQVKATAAGRITVMGNLNGIEMRRWTPVEAREETRRAIAAGAPGGGFILSDTHGEIPIQVPEDVLLAISDAVREFGNYPIDPAAGAR
ncbi:MAG: uroporphyrinogen decarboxylase [Actinomycetota bacterium]|nr:uroporphyrinogen decarboxylase [Actinomycetota bacterium]